MTLSARFSLGTAVLALVVSAGMRHSGELLPLGLPLTPAQGSAATLNVPPNATAEQLRDASLRQLGWTDAAVSYVGGLRSDGRARVLLTYLPNQQSTCKNDWTCLTGFFPGVDRVQITTDPADGLFARSFAHEYEHAINEARGYSDNTAGNVLYDLLELSQDISHPEAAWGARQILQLRDDDSSRADLLGYHGMLDHKDFSHLSIALIEFGVGGDAAKLPDWFRQAYYPYLRSTTPRLARPVTAPVDFVPADIASRVQRVVDLVAQYCGPVLDSAQTHAATTCASHPRLWPDVPYSPYPGANSSGPAAPGVAHSPVVDVPAVVPVAVSTPAAARPAPIVSHLADQGVVVVVSSPSGPLAPASPAPAGVGVGVGPLVVLPPSYPGQSPDEGSILMPVDATARLYYYIASGQRFNLTEAEVQEVLWDNPQAPVLSAPRDRIAQYQEAPPVNQGRLGLLEDQDN